MKLGGHLNVLGRRSLLQRKENSTQFILINFVSYFILYGQENGSIVIIPSGGGISKHILPSNMCSFLSATKLSIS